MHAIKLIIGVMIGASILAVTAWADTLQVGQAQRQSVDLTVYNDNLMMVNDRYQISLPAGDTVLRFDAISTQINPASAIIYPLPDGVQIRDQRFLPALSPEALLRGAVGQSVTLLSRHPATGEQSSERARVLSVENGLILEVNGHFETDLAGRRVVYDKLPAGVLKPTLEVALVGAEPQSLVLILSYLGRGIDWQADYVARLNAEHDKMHLTGMATVNNYGGMDFEKVRIELAAGTINQSSEGVPRPAAMLKTAAMESDAAVAQTPVGDLHLYELPGLYRLEKGTTHQFTLFSVAAVPVEKRYQLTGSAGIFFTATAGKQQLKADSYVEFKNINAQKLGLPLPAGSVRVYAATQNQTEGLRFIGSDRIDHTPELATVRLRTGKAFDINAVREQLAFKRLPVEQPYRQHSEITLSSRISNAHDQAVTVEVKELFNGTWHLVEGPEPAESDARSGSWFVQVPAKGETELRLTVRVKR